MTNKKISALTGATTPLAGTEVLPIVQGGVTVNATVQSVALATQPSGIAKGVVYLNAGKIPTTGSTLAYDGTSFGVGTLPSTSTLPSIESPYGIFAGQTQSYNVANAYFNSGWLYYGTGLATKYACVNGTHQWSNAVSGTAGNAITFVDMLTLGTTGNLTFNTGNLVQGTAAKGINFTANTPAAGMTSQLLNWYEEGTYTATLTPATSGTIPLNSSFDTLAYTRVGRLVTIIGQIQIFNPSLPIGAYFTLNLPYPTSDLTELGGRGGFTLNYQSSAVPVNWEESGSIVYVMKNAATVATSDNLYLSFSYFTS